MEDVFKVTMAVLGSLGGGAAIIFGFSNWLGKVWANRFMEKEKSQHAQDLEDLRQRLTRDTESHKIRLKKSEFLFEREFSAASELVAYRRRILPRLRYPEMDWGDACEEIAMRFSAIEPELNDYLAKHGAVLNENVKSLIAQAEGVAAEGKFEVTNGDVSDKGMKAAEELYEKLEAAEKTIIETVRSQSST